MASVVVRTVFIGASAREDRRVPSLTRDEPVINKCEPLRTSLGRRLRRCTVGSGEIDEAPVPFDIGARMSKGKPEEAPVAAPAQEPRESAFQPTQAQRAFVSAA